VQSDVHVSMARSDVVGVVGTYAHSTQLQGLLWLEGLLVTAGLGSLPPYRPLAPLVRQRGWSEPLWRCAHEVYIWNPPTEYNTGLRPNFGPRKAASRECFTSRFDD
jgi:hypothetical protein